MGLMIYMMVMDSQNHDHGGSMPEDQNLVPGLSLLNLAFFLLCSPVQVSQYNMSQGFYQVTECSDALLTLNISFSSTSCCEMIIIDDDSYNIVKNEPPRNLNSNIDFNVSCRFLEDATFTFRLIARSSTALLTWTC